VALNIGLISETYGCITTPPVMYGGIAATMHDLAEEFVKRGHSVRLFAIAGSHTSGDLVVVPAGDAQYDLYPDLLPPYVAEAKRYIVSTDVWIDGSHHKRFARWCLENRPEVNVICPSWNPNAVDLPQNPVFQSPHIYKVATGKEGGEHIPWFWFGIPLENYQPASEWSEHAVSVNVIAEHKGTDLLVAAAAKYHFPLHLYGPVDGLFFKRKIRQYMPATNVRFMGECGPERIDIIRNAAMSCTLSVWPEPGSRVTLESLALGCPCMVTAAGALPYYIQDGVNGAIVGRDPESIYAGYLRILDGGAAMRHAARETALEMFSMRKLGDNLERCFARLMDGERWFL
jgi:glycosyltransferase involved in cell wall biosynthesis